MQNVHKIGEVLSYLAENKKAYHVVDSEELARVSGNRTSRWHLLISEETACFHVARIFDIPHKEDCLVPLGQRE